MYSLPSRLWGEGVYNEAVAESEKRTMKILLCVSGGIAVYKSLELTRLFIKAGHEVQVVMTEGAKAFIQPLSFQTLSGRTVRDSVFDTQQEQGIGHIELARWPDCIVIAPATAETLAKLRVGRADDLMTTLCLATDRPVVVAPAMNRLMWQNPATEENCEVLRQRGYHLIAPDEGEQACGEVGAGRMPEPVAIERFVIGLMAEQAKLAQLKGDAAERWQGKKLLVTAGPTLEDIDPVRFIGNRSSGKMGFALAEAAQQLGAEVTLIAGPVQLATPTGVTRIDVRSAQQMFEQVQQRYVGNDCFISAAAVADYRVAQMAEQKLKKQSDQPALTLQLIKNPDIVAWVAEQANKPFVVGFAAETENVLGYAADKLQRKKLDAIIANEVGIGQKGFESDRNQVVLLTEKKHYQYEEMTKRQLAYALLQQISVLM